MEKTLKEDMATKIISEELVDDNTLLQFVKTEENSDVLQARVRYITHTRSFPVIGEHVIGNITLLGAYIQEENQAKTIHGANGNILEVNQQGIAYFVSTPADDRIILLSVYDVSNHRFVENDFKALKYQQFFGKPYGKKQFVKK